MVVKTIFITCIRGIISRNILSTNALTVLKSEPNTRVVIITPEPRAGVLRDEYASSNVEVIAMKTPPLAGVDKFLWVLSTNLLWSQTRIVQREVKFERDRNYLDYYFSKLLSLLGRVYFVRWLFRTIAAFADPGDEYDYMFKAHTPVLLFATDIYDPYDTKLIRSAGRNHVPVVGMVRSWDNITSKTLLNVIPDEVIVNADHVKEELVRYGDIPAKRISVIGIPHYDRYRDPKERSLRGAFFQKLGLDPDKKMVLFTPPSDRYVQGDPVTPIILASLGKADAQVLVRTSLVGKVEIGKYQPPENIVFDDPGMSPDFTDVHLNADADKHLADSLNQASVVITWASTMIIDAALFDKPIILIGFDAKPRPYGKSIQQYYDYEHQRYIIETGGVRLVKTPEELTEWVGKYLTNPALDAEGRRRIVKEHCGTLDGKAGERLGNYLLEKLEMNV